MVGQGKVRQAGHRLARCGMERLGKVRRGKVRHDLAGHGRQGLAMSGGAGSGKVRFGMARLGEVRQAWIARKENNMVYKKYSWRVNHGAPAQTVGETLERIERRDGTITREAFLEESRPEGSPTHACFEWDDSVAAEKYRLNQSSAVIRDIKVTIVSESAEPVKTAAFVNIMPNPTAQEAQYQSVDVAVSDTDTRKTVLQNALDDLIKLRIKYRDLTELAGIFDAIEKAIKEAA